ncbi:MAG: hypothetical protein AAGF11_24100 [Myxococcota bacterium]
MPIGGFGGQLLVQGNLTRAKCVHIHPLGSQDLAAGRALRQQQQQIARATQRRAR